MSTRKSKLVANSKPRKLTDLHVETLREFFNSEGDDGDGKTYPDSIVRGLHIFVGRNKTIWRFQRRRRIKGTRHTTFKSRGKCPLMTYDAAGEAAEIEAGKVASGTAEPSRRKAAKFE